MIHVGPVGDYEGIGIVLEKNYVIHVKLRDSRKTTWFTLNYVNHGEPANDFLVERNAPTFGYIVIT